MNADGTRQRNVRSRFHYVPPACADVPPAWSPDGRKLAFGSLYARGSAEIYVVNADGSRQWKVTQQPGDDVFPAWSPVPTR